MNWAEENDNLEVVEFLQSMVNPVPPM